MKIITRLIFVLGFIHLLVLPVKAGGSDSALDGVLNAAYTIERQAVQLMDGRAEVEAAPGSATRVTTAVFGEPVFGDLNGDGVDDAALLLVHDPGGSGTFYYVAAAIAENGGWQGTNAVFLGDRVAPRTIQVQNGLIAADYLDRRSDQPMASAPSIPKTMYLTLKNGRLEAVKTPSEKRVK